MIGAGPPGLEPLGLEAHVRSPVMHDLVAELPLEAIDEIQNPTRLVQLAIHVVRRWWWCSSSIAEGKMVNVDVEVDAVGEVVGGGEGAEAAREGVEAVVGEDLDDECEIGVVGILGVKDEIRVRVWVWGGEGD